MTPTDLCLHTAAGKADRKWVWWDVLCADLFFPVQGGEGGFPQSYSNLCRMQHWKSTAARALQGGTHTHKRMYERRTHTHTLPGDSTWYTAKDTLSLG